MKPQSIRVRLTLWYSLILALSLSLFGGGAYLAMRHSIYATLDAELRQRLEGVRGIISEDAPHGATALEDEFHEFAVGQGARGRLRVADAAGRVSSRVLICKDVDDEGRWSFASDAESVKGRDLAANPCAAASFGCGCSRLRL